MAAVVAVNGADSALALLIFLHHHRRKIVVGSLVFQIWFSQFFPKKYGQGDEGQMANLGATHLKL